MPMKSAPTEKKKSMTALGLSIGMPGLGQIYLGQGEFGAFLYLLPNVTVVVCFLFTNVVGILSSLLFLFMVYFYACLKAYYDAKKLREPVARKAYNRSSVYLVLWFAHVGFTFWLTNPESYLGSHVVIRAFKAHSIAMEPAILRGDLLFTFRRPFQDLSLARGDLVVVAEPPPNRRYQVRRVVAIPGDHIRLYDGHVYINDIKLPVVEPEQEPDFARSGFLYFMESNAQQAYFVSHKTGSSHKSGEWTVGENKYFVMADRRYLFDDSARWGPVDDDAVIGRVAFIVWPRGAMSRFGVVKPGNGDPMGIPQAQLGKD